MHKRLSCVAVVGALLLGPAVARAGEASDRLAQCLVENASPKDQAALMRWMFSAVSANPALKTMAPLSREDRDGINQAMARTFQRLMLEDCRGEVVAALRSDGDKAVEGAFEVMGRRAAEQLLSDPASEAELQKMAAYIDAEKWTALLKEGGVDPQGKQTK